MDKRACAEFRFCYRHCTLALLGIVQRQIKAKRTPETSRTVVRKPLLEAKKSLGQWIRYWRLTKGLTLRQLVQSTGLKQWRIRAMERDSFVPEREELALIETALGLETGNFEAEG